MIFKRPRLYLYNDDTLNFLERNGFSIDDVDMMFGNEKKIVESREVDSIVDEVALYAEESVKVVSIADVLGYDMPKSKDLFLSISDFFDSYGDGYHSRSVGMLEYNSNEVVEKLEDSFRIEPIKLKEIDDGKYFVDANGMHRYTVLRAHYLFDKKRGILSEEKLRKKYTVTVMSKTLDKVKSYTAFLLKLFNDNLYVSSDLDEDYRKTGNTRVINDKTGDKKILGDEELIIYATEVLTSSGLDVSLLWKIAKHVEVNKSFTSFLITYFGQLYNEVMKFIEFKNNCEGFEDFLDFQISDEFKEKSVTWNL